ncbi:MAG: lactonase family protein [Holophagales bacterium]|nr:lactonase family protein [Holophagales bacterium]
MRTSSISASCRRVARSLFVACCYLFPSWLLAPALALAQPTAILVTSSSDPQELWSIDSQGADLEPLTSLVGSARVGPLTHEAEDRFFALGDGTLFSIETATGAVEEIGAIQGASTVRGLASLADGTLWTVADGILTRLDTATASIVEQVPLTTDVRALAAGGDRLFAVADEPSEGGWSVYEVDPSSGDGSLIRTLPYSDVPGLVLDAEVDREQHLWLVAQDFSLAAFGAVARTPLAGGQVDYLVSWGAGGGPPFFAGIAVRGAASVVEAPTHSARGLTLLMLGLAAVGWLFLHRMGRLS